MIRILIVEDEKPISNLICWNLTDCGYRCSCAFDGMEAADLLVEHTYDLVLLDIMLPHIDGYSLLEQIRPTGTPVIFLTAKGSIADRVRGLRAGADDYLVKPFAITELIARVESVLRRSGRVSGTIRLGDVVICQDSMTVSKGGQPVSLTLKEYELLLLFVQNPNTALFRQTIYQRVWDCDYMADTRTVDLHVQRLRKKLGWQEKLVSVYKVGYRLEVAL